MKDNRRRTDKTQVIIGIKLIKWAKQTSLQVEVQVYFLKASLAPSHATQRSAHPDVQLLAVETT